MVPAQEGLYAVDEDEAVGEEGGRGRTLARGEGAEAPLGGRYEEDDEDGGTPTLNGSNGIIYLLLPSRSLMAIQVGR